jgi:hypothetical protein
MAKKYIQALVDWPGFTWDAKVLAPLLSDVRSRRIADFWCYPSVRLDGFVYIAGLEWKEVPYWKKEWIREWMLISRRPRRLRSRC